MPATKNRKMRRPLAHASAEDIILVRNGQTSMLSQEVKACGVCLLDNLLSELSTRDLKEIKTDKLVDQAIKLAQLLVEKSGGQGAGDREPQSDGYAEVVGNIGMKND